MRNGFFQREAQVLASLNHPNLAAIYGLEESGGMPALIRELVEGPTLRDRIGDGPFPLDEAIHIVQQIVQAREFHVTTCTETTRLSPTGVRQHSRHTRSIPVSATISPLFS